MKHLLLSLIMALVIIACRESDKGQPNNQISIGIRDSLFSNILNEERQVWIYVPQGATNKKYPVVYLLDGDAHFSSVVGMIQQLSTVNGNTLCPEMIVVGIPNTDRTRDLTPTHVKEMFGDTVFAKSSGGGESFTRFIKEELMPFIDKSYPTTPYRTLIGHSFGGLFAINTIVNHPEMFNNYLAIDPSLWWDDRKLSMRANEVLGEPDYKGKSLFVAVANTMQPGMDLALVESDTSKNNKHIKSILEFNKRTDSKTDKELTFKWKYYSEDSHGSVPLIAEHDALRFLFSWYVFKDTNKLLDDKSKLSPEENISLVIDHFKNVSEHFGYPVTPDETMMNSIGYSFLLESHKPDHAFAFFKMNAENYPQSANVFDSMGDYYLNQKDTGHAIENFTKAVSMGNLPYSKEKLTKLKKE